MEAGQNILLERLRQGMTQAKLARLAGIPQPNLSRVEKGKQDITVSTLKRISLALNVHAGRLLGEELEDRGKAAPVVLTRARIERIARLVVKSDVREKGLEARLASLFRRILPARGVRRSSAKDTLLAWVELRRTFDQSQINAVLGRVRDAELRAA